mmetsp:Transcript_48966/g.36041  ORF Transcript_48966/g.36041 Transcript_48966/m.36041 type:complete len:95 (+) Transcript_48966:194-478(+)
MCAYIEGQVIDGENHSFTSTTTSNCDVLDVYFWNRFPSFKQIDSIKALDQQEHLYMRWYEKGKIKQRPKVTRIPEQLEEEEESGEEAETVDYLD